jgi:integrase
MAWIVSAKLKKGTRYYVQYKDDNGKNITYGKYPTKALANDARLECEIQQSQKKTVSKVLKISEIWKIYKTRKLNIRESTLLRYTQQLQAWYNTAGDLDIKKVTVDTIYSFIDKRKQTVKTKTINEELSLLRTIFKYAVKWDYLEKNVFEKVDNLKVDDKKEMQALTTEQIQKVYAALEEHDTWFSDVFTVALYTGMRRGELYALKWENINFGENTIFVQVTKTVPDYVPIHKKVKTILLRLQHEYSEKEYLDGYVFRTILGSPLAHHTSVLSHFFKRIMAKVGYPEITQFHSTRHTFVTHVLKHTKDKMITSFISRHKSNAIDTYIHDIHAEEKQKAIADFEY